MRNGSLKPLPLPYRADAINDVRFSRLDILQVVTVAFVGLPVRLFQTEASRCLPKGRNPMFQYEKRLVSKKELKSVCGIPYTPQHIGRLEAAGKFPKRVTLGPGRVAWVLAEVDAWLSERIAERDTPSHDPSF